MPLELLPEAIPALTRLVSPYHYGLKVLYRAQGISWLCVLSLPFLPSPVFISKHNLYKTFEPINNLTPDEATAVQDLEPRVSSFGGQPYHKSWGEYESNLLMSPARVLKSKQISSVFTFQKYKWLMRTDFLYSTQPCT